MPLDKTVNRYLTRSDVTRGCQYKKRYPEEIARGLAAEKGIKAYHCHFGKHWHIGHSRHLKRILEPRERCPKGCLRDVKVRKMEGHLLRCGGVPIAE